MDSVYEMKQRNVGTVKILRNELATFPTYDSHTHRKVLQVLSILNKYEYKSIFRTIKRQVKRPSFAE